MESAQNPKSSVLIGIVLALLALPFLIGLILLFSIFGGLNVPEEKGENKESSVGKISDEIRYANHINLAAEKTGLNPALIAGVIKQESGFNSRVTSSAGAQGLMQIMPGTAKELGVKDPFDPKQNILGGSKYLKKMIDRYDSIPIGLAAYNAGPGSVDRHGGKIPPYPETTDYVRKVMGYYEELKKKVKKGKLIISTGKLANPAPQAEISSPYGPRNGGMHRGQDFAAPVGTPIRAAADGQVIRVRHLGDRSYGSYIVIDHGGGIQTLYAHMWRDQVQVEVGQTVKRGQKIGEIGNNGRSSGPHLHFEVIKDGSKVNPQKYLK